MLIKSCMRPFNRIAFGLLGFKHLPAAFARSQLRPASTKTASAPAFSAPVFETKVFKDFVDSAVSAYDANRAAVDSEVSQLLNSHKLLLFMEGSVDAPKSLCAANIVKMFTLLQVLNFHTVDVLAHREVFGFLCSKL